MSNITLAVDDQIVEKAREAARRQGTSLQDLVRDYLATLAGEKDGSSLVEELRRHWQETDKYFAAHPPAEHRKFNRDEIYEERLGRTRRRTR
jgi:hypothetical protein